MKILIVATKPPWPPRDGGRLVLQTTVDALIAAGHEIALVAPVDPDAPAGLPAFATCVSARRRSWLAAALDAVRHGQALTVARHRSAEVADAVAHLIDTWRPDVVHAEQLQAFANVPARDVPLVLRMQNVESSLWQQVAQARRSARWLAPEARRLRRDEARAIATAARTVALTARDAKALREIGGRDVDALAPPFPTSLPAAPPVRGEPAVALSGSAGWWPNRQGTRWFLDGAMPHLRRLCPGVRVHVYGGERVECEGVEWHRAPDDAQDAFPAGAIAAVPLLIGSGIRMRILEAWARGLPVVATPVAAAGLDVVAGRELLVADTPAAFAQAIAEAAADAALRAQLVEAGRAYLAAHHDPLRQAHALAAAHASARTLRA